MATVWILRWSELISAVAEKAPPPTESQLMSWVSCPQTHQPQEKVQSATGACIHCSPGSQGTQKPSRLGITTAAQLQGLLPCSRQLCQGQGSLRAAPRGKEPTRPVALGFVSLLVCRSGGRVVTWSARAHNPSPCC